MPKKKKNNTDNSQVVLLPGIFNDTVELLLESYEYFQQNGIEDQMQIPPSVRTFYTAEMSRISTRLSSIMAWLMIRKAVLQGKLSEKEAEEKFQFEANDLCLGQNIEAEHFLPKPMNKLLNDTLQLYERVLRLDIPASPGPKKKTGKKKK